MKTSSGATIAYGRAVSPLPRLIDWGLAAARWPGLRSIPLNALIS